jgi:hypothetical protein
MVNSDSGRRTQRTTEALLYDTFSNKRNFYAVEKEIFMKKYKRNFKKNAYKYKMYFKNFRNFLRKFGRYRVRLTKKMGVIFFKEYKLDTFSSSYKKQKDKNIV